MFDISQISNNFFSAKIEFEDDDGEVKRYELEINAPKTSHFKQLISAKTIDEVIEALSKIFSRNKTHFNVTVEMLENFEYPSLIELKNAYLNWLNDIRNKKN